MTELSCILNCLVKVNKKICKHEKRNLALALLRAWLRAWLRPCSTLLSFASPWNPLPVPLSSLHLALNMGHRHHPSNRDTEATSSGTQGRQSSQWLRRLRWLSTYHARQGLQTSDASSDLSKYGSKAICFAKATSSNLGKYESNAICFASAKRTLCKCNDLLYMLHKAQHPASAKEIGNLVKEIGVHCPWYPKSGYLRVKDWYLCQETIARFATPEQKALLANPSLACAANLPLIQAPASQLAITNINTPSPTPIPPIPALIPPSSALTSHNRTRCIKKGSTSS